MPRGQSKPKTYNRYAVDLHDAITYQYVRTEYFKDMEEIADKLNLKVNTIRFIVQKRNKKLCPIYDIYHIDKDKNRIDDIWLWKTDHKKRTIEVSN